MRVRLHSKEFQNNGLPNAKWVKLKSKELKKQTFEMRVKLSSKTDFWMPNAIQNLAQENPKITAF